MKISIGHKVKFINENLEGKIVSVLTDKRVVVDCSDGFEHEVSINEIVIIGEDNEHLYNVDVTKISAQISDIDVKEKGNFLGKYINTNK